MQTVKIKTAMAGATFNYRKNDIVEMTDQRAQSYIKRGYAESYTPNPGEKVIRSKANDPKTLPDDCPDRELLIEAGLDTPEKVLQHEDLTMIKGIGEAKAGQIIEFLKDQ